MHRPYSPDIRVKMIKDNPRLRVRTTPMKVLVLGFPRTGTSSMQKALEQLGFGPCYHMRTCVDQFPNDCAMWMEAFKAKYDGIGKFGKKEWDQLLGHYGSVCDLPAVAFLPELMTAYPSARIILTYRNADSWHRSCSKTLLQARWYWAHEVLQYLDWITALVHPLRKKQWQCLFADDFEANGKLAMESHYTEVRHLARQQKREVLEMGLYQDPAWEPLCKFLGVDVPDSPYPRLNEGQEFIMKMKGRARMRARAAGLKFVRVALVVLVALAVLWRLRQLSPLSTYLNDLRI